VFEIKLNEPSLNKISSWVISSSSTCVRNKIKKVKLKRLEYSSVLRQGQPMFVKLEYCEVSNDGKKKETLGRRRCGAAHDQKTPTLSKDF
jgi:hypothetical protein